MKKRLLALLLVLVMGLSLVACSAPAADDPNPSDNVTSTPTPDAGTEEPIVADLSQDILSFAAGDLADGSALLTVNGNAIPNSLFLYWLAFSCSYFEGSYYYYGLTVADYADYILSDACTMAAYYDLLARKCTEYGCPLTDTQLETIKTDNGVGGEDHEMRKSLYGLTEEDLMFIYSIGSYYENLTQALVPAPTQEDLDNYVYQAKHILITTAASAADGKVTLTTGETVEYAGTAEEYNTEAQAKAQSILDQLTAADPAELEALFDQLMNEHSEDGRDAEGNLAAPEGYTTTTGQMVAEFENAALALEPGQISGLVLSSYGYHIILRGEVEDMDSYAEGYSTAKMDELTNQWLADAEIIRSDSLTSLDVADFYNHYITWQEAFVAEQEPELKTETE